MTDISSIDPRTGEAVEVVAQEATPEQVDAAVKAAVAAFPRLSQAAPQARADLLRHMADRLDEAGETIIALADRETALGTIRLTGELARTTFQLRHFAEVVLDGGYQNVTIDHADPQAAPVPRPDLRRFGVPTGPVAVFSASNFPLAFSVPGGDTASALAAGCPVVVKAHQDHPATSLAVADILRKAAVEQGFSADLVSVVFGRAAGVALVGHEGITAAGFTGSVAGGRALFDIASQRDTPIPFFGELGSVNPLVITPSALAERTESIAAGLSTAFTQGVGQFCTKPGVVFVPAGDAADELVRLIHAELDAKPAGAMLDSRMAGGYRDGVAERAKAPGVQLLEGKPEPAAGQADHWVQPAVVRVAAADLAAGSLLLEECFGPVTVVVDYRNEDELASAVAWVPNSLTATVHAGASDREPWLGRIVDILSSQAGRIIWNGFPTGVSVTWAQQHGGPYPATTAAGSTSVGADAISRWLRAVSYQDWPQDLLPAALREDNPLGVPRRVDGKLELPA